MASILHGFVVNKDGIPVQQTPLFSENFLVSPDSCGPLRSYRNQTLLYPKTYSDTSQDKLRKFSTYQKFGIKPRDTN